MESEHRSVYWIGSSRKDLKEFPEQVQDMIGYTLFAIQCGEMPREAKPLHGFNPSVLEIVSNYNNDTYRAVYTVRLTRGVYILHCFQKKSKHGIKTPQKEIDLIKQRLNQAIEQDSK